MPITLSSNERQLFLGIHRNFGVAYEAASRVITEQFLDKENSNQILEEYVETFPFNNFEETNENQVIPTDTFGQLIITQIRNKKFSKRYIITSEALADNRYPEALRKATSMGDAAARTPEVEAARFLQDGFTNIQTETGQPLFSNQQPLKAGVFSNISTVPKDLTEAGLVTDQIQIRTMPDPSGNTISIEPKTLLVGFQNAAQAVRLMESALQVGTNNNDINVVGRSSGMFPGGVKVSNHITDKSYVIKTSVWGFVFQERESVRMMSNPIIETGNHQVSSQQRFGFGAPDKRGAFGTPGL